MNFMFLIGGIISLAIFIFLLVKLFVHYNENSALRAVRYLAVAAFCYLVVSVLSFFWFFDYLKYSFADYSVMFAILLLIQNGVLFKVSYMFSKNKKLYYLLALYLISIPLLFLVAHTSVLLFIVDSFLFSIILFTEFSIRADVYRRVGLFGIVYSAVSLLLVVLFMAGFGNFYMLTIASVILFFFFLYLLICDLKVYSIPVDVKMSVGKSYMVKLFSHLAFIIILANFVFIGTVAIHELGHLSTSKFYDCDYQKIVYEGGLFHTEILCADGKVTPMVTLGGILLPLLLAVVLLFLGGKFLKEIGLLMIGFNLSAISRDLGALGLSDNLVISTIIFGAVFVIWGMMLLAKSKTEEEFFSDSMDSAFDIKSIKEYNKNVSLNQSSNKGFNDDKDGGYKSI